MLLQRSGMVPWMKHLTSIARNRMPRHVRSMHLMGLMQKKELLISGLIDHAAQVYGDNEIVSRTIEDPTKIHRCTYTDIDARSKQIANALAGLGVQRSDRVGTIAWNGYRHLELYFGVSGSGAVLHTMNPRMAPAQLAHVINHAEDKVLCVDLTFLPLVEAIQAHIGCVKHVVVMTDKANMPQTKLTNAICYEDLLSGASAQYEWPQIPEESASVLCYTSGTTGNPKGVLYSNRSVVLHAFGMTSANSLNLGARDACLPVVPMFHVNAWGIPYAAAISGCKLVFPGAAMDGKSIYELLRDEKVTKTAGVPTIWQMLLHHMDEVKQGLPDLGSILIGGSACPPDMIRQFEAHGVYAQHAWGMTEMGPTGVVNEQPRLKDGADEVKKLKQGRTLYGVELKCVGEDGKDCPRDGQTRGMLLSKGYWVARQYYKMEKEAVNAGGWFDTGDIATITADGYMEVVDRTKDLIKSGGEWISSISIENIALGNPDVLQAAAIAVPNEKWGERPVLLLVLKPSATSSAEAVASAVRESCKAQLHKIEVPDHIESVEALPIGGTGKVLKNVLRDDYVKGTLKLANKA